MSLNKREPSVKMLSVIIVDDVAVARARLRRPLSNEPDVEIVAECENGRDAVHAILDHAPDLVFLDIEMPELNGFDVLRTLPQEAVPVFVFVTAFGSHVLDAFAVDALDYLLKPFDAERFQVADGRAFFVRRGSRAFIGHHRESRSDQGDPTVVLGRRPGDSAR